MTIKAIVEAALADFFTAAGLWPPPPSDKPKKGKPPDPAP